MRNGQSKNWVYAAFFAIVILLLILLFFFIYRLPITFLQSCEQFLQAGVSDSNLVAIFRANYFGAWVWVILGVVCGFLALPFLFLVEKSTWQRTTLGWRTLWTGLIMIVFMISSIVFFAWVAWKQQSPNAHISYAKQLGLNCVRNSQTDKACFRHENGDENSECVNIHPYKYFFVMKRKDPNHPKFHHTDDLRLSLLGLLFACLIFGGCAWFLRQRAKQLD